MRPTMVFFLPFLAIFAVGCGDTGQREVSYPIYLSGQPASAFMAGEWEVTLDVARVGFGPAYFCATAAASADLCSTAVAEYADSAEGDGLDHGTPREIGQVTGVTGQIRSTTFDYAITWFPTQSSPRPTSAAPGGHSAQFEGRAVKGETALRFVADVDVVPSLQGTLAVQGARVTADVQHDGVRLDVRIDPASWWRGVDFSELATLGGDPVVLAKDSRAYNAVVIGMTAAAPPTFEWSAR